MGKRIYSDEFKLEALRLLRERDVSVSQVARELGVKQQTLQRWKQQQEAGKQVAAASAPQRSQSQELERLRRENVRLRAERDILKKALGYFAKEPK
jgi:transposase